MSIDLDKLSPAPWVAWGIEPNSASQGNFYGIAGLPLVDVDKSVSFLKQDANFIALARNAFEIMIRRGWTPHSTTNGRWIVRTREGYNMPLAFHITEPHRGYFSNPFTALVEADKWYSEKGGNQ